MSDLSRKEFDKIYHEKLEPMLKSLDIERIENDKKAKRSFLLLIPSLVICIPICYFCNFQTSIIIFLVLFFINILLYVNIKEKERKKLKQLLLPEILKIYGNLYFSENKDSITHKDIYNMGLFRHSTSKSTDDVIIGIDRGCNFVISETKLTHTESQGSGKHRTTRTVTDFEGLIVKIQMKKSFTGKTVVGIKGHISKPAGCENVVLESVDFMRNREVYSTDQIEARYLLTTAFMERLTSLAENFQNDNTGNIASLQSQSDENYLNTSIKIEIPAVPAIISNTVKRGLENLYERVSGVSAGFVNGYVYLFIPTSQNFFEVSTNDTLLNPVKYYSIYLQLKAILNIIEYLNLDKNMGL